MMKEKNRKRTGSGWAGALQRKRSAHETHLGYESRSMYHGLSNLVKKIFGARRKSRILDKSGTVPYSVALNQETAAAHVPP
jgi:hypothetical protein